MRFFRRDSFLIIEKPKTKTIFTFWMTSPSLRAIAIIAGHNPAFSPLFGVKNHMTYKGLKGAGSHRPDGLA